jgi:branched-chain amino acid transport system substrate-binding protein
VVNLDKKIILGIIIVLVIAALTFVLISSPNPTASFTFAPKDTLLIGASLSLTGKAASYGSDIKNGIEFAIEELKKNKKPIKVSILFDDTASSPQNATTSAQKFIQVDKAKAIITLGADETLAVTPITENNNIILFTPIGGSDKIDSSGEYVFRNREASKLTTDALANLLDKKGYDKVVLFVAKTSASAISYEQFFIEKFSSLGKKVELSFHYDETQPDVRIGIAKAIEANINAIYVIAGKDKDGGEVINQLKQMGFTGLIVGGPALDTDKFFEVTQRASEGLIIAISMIDKNAPNAKTLLQDYNAKYKKEMNQWAANAFDMINLLNESAIKCGSDTKCIKNYLYSVKDYPGLGGKTTFNELGGVTKPMQYKIVKNGKFVLYEAI